MCVLVGKKCSSFGKFGLFSCNARFEVRPYQSYQDHLRNRRQVLLLILSEFKGIDYFSSPRSRQKTIVFLIFLG